MDPWWPCIPVLPCLSVRICKVGPLFKAEQSRVDADPGQSGDRKGPRGAGVVEGGN